MKHNICRMQLQLGRVEIRCLVNVSGATAHSYMYGIRILSWLSRYQSLLSAVRSQAKRNTLLPL